MLAANPAGREPAVPRHLMEKAAAIATASFLTKGGARYLVGALRLAGAFRFAGRSRSRRGRGGQRDREVITAQYSKPSSNHAGMAPVTKRARSILW